VSRIPGARGVASMRPVKRGILPAPVLGAQCESRFGQIAGEADRRVISSAARRSSKISVIVMVTLVFPPTGPLSFRAHREDATLVKYSTLRVGVNEGRTSSTCALSPNCGSRPREDTGKRRRWFMPSLRAWAQRRGRVANPLRYIQRHHRLHTRGGESRGGRFTNRPYGSSPHAWG
jgi:hypothetical protein